MKKFAVITAAVLILAAYFLPVLNSKITASETDALNELNRQITEKEIDSLYREICNAVSAGSFRDVTALCDNCLSLASYGDYPEIYADVLLKKAAAMYECGDCAHSLELCNQLIQLSPDTAEIYLLKAQNQNRLGDNKGEKSSLADYSALSGEKSVYSRIGEIEMTEGNYQSAVEAFDIYDTSCLSPASQTDAAVFSRGVCCLSMGDYVRASDDFRRCLENNIEANDSAFELAVCLMKLGNTQEAKEYFELCIQNGFRAQEAAELEEIC